MFFVLVRFVGVAARDLRWGIDWLAHAATNPRCSGDAHAGTFGKRIMGCLCGGEPAIVGSVSIPCRTTLDLSPYSFVDEVSRRCNQARRSMSTCAYDS